MNTMTPRILPQAKVCGEPDTDCGHLMATVGCWRMGYAGERWISTAHSYNNGLNWAPIRQIRSFGISAYYYMTGRTVLPGSVAALFLLYNGRTHL